MTVRARRRDAPAPMARGRVPTRDELLKATRMIIILALLLGVAIGLLDWVLQLILVEGVARLAR